MTPIVFVQWADAHGNSGWFSNAETARWSEGDWYCDCVGYLIKETKKELVFALQHEPDGHTNGQEQWGNLLRIPTTWVKNRRVLGYIKHDGTFVAKKRSG